MSTTHNALPALTLPQGWPAQIAGPHSIVIRSPIGWRARRLARFRVWPSLPAVRRDAI